ncbi:MAG: hypothetical protein V8S94_02595 [Methanobrevibacter smithii]
MNIDYEIVESAKTEFSELKNKRYHLDYVGKTKDKIYIHIEFQARFPTKKELQRIFAYVALLHEYTGCFVETYIICVQAIPHDQIIHQYSKDNVFKINIMSLKNIDGNKKINSISKKIENNEKLTPTEILALKLMPFTSYKEPTEEITLKTAQLTNKITTLTIDELNNIKYIQQAVCSKVIKKEHQQPIMEEIKMRNTLYDQARKEGRKEGKTEGIKEGINEGRKEGRNEGKNEMKNEITNEITTLIQKGKLPQDTLNQIHSLKM